MKTRPLPVVTGLVLAIVMVGLLVSRFRTPSVTTRSESATNPAPLAAASSTPIPNSESSQDRAGEVTTTSATNQQVTRDATSTAGLQVRVLDDAGHVLSGASIWVIPSQAVDFPPKREIDSEKLCDELAEVRGVSDPTGSCNWPALLPARRIVVARKRGFAAAYAWSDEGEEAAPAVSIELRQGGSVRGIVHDGDANTPAVGAFITMMPRAKPGFESDAFGTFVRFLLGGSTHTGADGRFELEQASGETSELYCTLPGRPQIYVDWIVPNDQELSLRFVENVAISGTVSDENGAPIAGANIYITTPGVLPLPTTEPVHSDDHGDFVCEMIPPGPIELKVDKRGFGVYKQAFVVKGGEELFTITLRPEVDFSGTVVGTRGEPIDGATVSVIDAKQFVMCGQMKTLTDGSWFMFWVPKDGIIDVRVKKDGFVEATLRGLSAPQTDLRIELRPVSGLDGRVVDASGVPVSQFAFRSATRGVSQVQEHFDRVEDPWYPVNSPDGHFGFGNAFSGLTEVSVRATGYRPKTIADIPIDPGERVGPVEFRLEPSPSVQGMVVDSSEKPVVGASVEIAEATFDGRAVLTREPFGAPTGIDGRFLIDTVPDGVFTLVIRRGENCSVFADLRVGDFPRTFILEAEGEIIGTINGSWTRPETCVRVRVSLDGTWIGREIRSDSDGRFHVSSLAPGDYRIELIDDWSEQERLRDGRVTSFATVRSGETTIVVLDATGSGVIEGRVVTTGSRLVGQQLSIRAFVAGKEGPPVAESSVDGGGLFRFDHLHAGSYRIRVGSYERGTALALDREVTVPDNATVGPIEIVIGSGGLSGRVLRDDGSPADARVSLVESSSGHEVAVVRTDADGTYRLLSAPDGNYVVVASAATFADGYAGPVAFPGVSDAPALEQRLAKESRVLARVRDDLGRAVGGAVVEIDVTTRPPPLRQQVATSDGRGQAEFMRLPAGSLTASASKAGFVPADPIVVGLAPDQRRTVDLVLARCGSIDVVVKDARGQTLAGVELTASLVEDDARGEGTRHGKSGSRGSVRFSGLRPGRWQISGDATDQAKVEIDPGATVTVELTAQR